ncbi:MAG TPA: hypothetical protein ENL03_04115, partial [Phycisphaerae bacterium]|nr:hypothetical protein [Phycisphaerae bacterium]
MKIVRVVPLCVLFCLIAGGCTSQATFEGVDAQQVCAHFGIDVKPGKPQVWKSSGFLTDYVKWMKIGKAGDGMVQVQFRCTDKFPAWWSQTHRDESRERFELALLTEWIQRVAGGSLKKSNVEGLDRIPAVHVITKDDSSEILLAGANEQNILAELRTGLNDITLYSGQNFQILNSKEQEGVLRFLLRLPQGRIRSSDWPRSFRLEIIPKSDHMVLRCPASTYRRRA